MDAITTFALSINEPIIRAVGGILDNAVIYALLIIGLLFIAESRNEKRAKVLVSFAITLMLVTVVKAALAHERPCMEEDWCPADYSFPSMHAAIAFTLMTAFVNKKNYVLFLFFALFVSFTRLNIGVHIFQDIAAALPIALISYYITDIIWKEWRKKHGEGD